MHIILFRAKTGLSKEQIPHKMIIILLRTIIIYLFLIFGMKMMGKRQIGEMQISELVTAFLLSELAATPILNVDIPLLYALLPILLLLSLEIIFSFLTTKAPFFKKLFDGTPNILISKGKILQSELLKSRISAEELISQIRLGGVADLSEVEYALLEQNGRLSVFTKKDCNGSGIPHTLVIDGNVSKNSLSYINKDEKWVHSRIKKHGHALSDIFIFTVDDSGKEYIVTKGSVGGGKK